MNFILPDLPYALDHLEPFISSKTLEIHYHKHHQGYVDKLNILTKDSDWAKVSIEELIKSTEGNIFNNAAQVWNHAFYWRCLSREKLNIPDGNFMKAIKQEYGNPEHFREQFIQTAVTLFGSGWAWLVKSQEGELKIMQGTNAWNPIQENYIPLLTYDVWEHAYYLDYQNRRLDYLDEYWQHIDWESVEDRFNADEHLLAECC